MNIHTMTEKFKKISRNGGTLAEARVAYILILMYLCIASVQAQTYATNKMEALSSELPVDCLPQTDSIFNCSELVTEKSLVVNYNGNNEIVHIGISLFSNETKELLSLPVCNFIERIMLELTLEQTNKDFDQKLDRLKLSLRKNGLKFGEFGFSSISDVLDEINIPARFSLLREDDKFSAVWKYNQDDEFIFMFPASRELILGTDKKESDELLNRTLFSSGRRCSEKSDATAETVAETNLTFDSERNIFTLKGADLMLAVINASTYYQKTADNAFNLLFSKDFPVESFKNLVLKNMVNMNHKLHVTHRMYGNFSPDFDMPFHEFLCYFQDEYNIFAGVSFPEPKKDPNKIKLTAVLRNKDYAYCHLLLITTTVDNIFSQGGLLTAELYSNIPQQSIRSLVGDINNK